MSWLDAVISYAGSYATLNAIRAISPVPNQSILVYCIASSSAWYWQPASAAADDGATALAPSNSLDAAKGRWLLAALGGSDGSVTLAGDASGASSANTVSHVTGGTNTHVHGSSSVRLIANGVDTLVADADGVLVKTTRVRTGTGAPTASDPDGSIYLRTDGSAATTAYVRAGGAWTALATSASVTLAGDCSGSPGSNIVTNVTGDAVTTIGGTTGVETVIDGDTVLYVSSAGLTVAASGESGVQILNGAGAPAASSPDGSIYLRTDGTSATTAYIRAASTWSPLVPSTEAITLDGDVTGDPTTNVVEEITGTASGCKIHRPTANPTVVDANYVLQFPSKGLDADTDSYSSDRDQWRWLQRNNCGPVVKGFYFTINAGQSRTIRLISFGGITDNTEIQGFFGQLHLLMTPCDSSAIRAYCEWTVPVHAFCHVLDPSTYQVHVHTVSTCTKADIFGEYTGSNTFNSGFSYSGRTGSDVPVRFDMLNGISTRKLSRATGYVDGANVASHTGSVLLDVVDDSSPSGVIATITPPESAVQDVYTSGWGGTFYNKDVRVRGWVQGVWTLEHDRKVSTYTTY